jgi:ferric-dicitrate binding protein FerR (iron transport regulator)
MTPQAERDRPDAGDRADALARLIRAAGARQVPPADAAERVYAVAESVWRGTLARRRRRRAAWAVAASLVLAAVVARLAGDVGGPAPAALAARSDRVVGEVASLAPGDTVWRPVAADRASLPAGTRLRSGTAAGAGLVLAGGTSLRLGASTEILLESAGRAHLRSGRVYVDAGPRPGVASPLEIVTAQGSVSHVGTQFELAYGQEGLRLRVREGSVLLQRGGSATSAAGGTEIFLGADGTLRRATVAGHGPDWDWVQALAPAPELRDRPLSVLLQWVARETGREVRFARPELRERAGRTTLHGAAESLLPMEALAAVLATTDLRYELVGEGHIRIDERPR